MKRKQVISLLMMLMVAFSMCAPTMAKAPKAPAKVTSISVSKSGSKATVKWKKLKKSPSGYAIYQKKGSGSWKLVKRASKKSSSASISIKTTEKNQFKVRAYKTYKVKKYYNKKAKKYVSKKAYKKLKKKYRCTKKVTAYKYGKYSSTKTINAVAKSSSSSGSSSTAKQYQMKYDYTLTACPVDEYTDKVLVIGIKSNNPSNTYKAGGTIAVYFVGEDGKTYYENLSDDTNCAYSSWNIKNRGSSGMGYRVIGCEGGFLGIFGKGTVSAGKYRVFVREYNVDTSKTWANGTEYDDDTTEFKNNSKNYADKEIGTIEVKSYDELETAYYKSVLAEITTDSMTKEEKMDAVVDWMFENYTREEKLEDADGNTYQTSLMLKSAALPYTCKSVVCGDVCAIMKDFGELIGYPLETQVEGAHVYAVHKDENGNVDKDFNFSPPKRANGTLTEDDYIDLSKM